MIRLALPEPFYSSKSLLNMPINTFMPRGLSHNLLATDETDPSFTTFIVKSSEHFICWVMNKQEKTDPAITSVPNAESFDGGSFKTRFFCSTLSHGWIPADHIELISLLVIDVRQRWDQFAIASSSFLTLRVCQ